MSNLQQWLTQRNEPDGSQINIDGKTIRGSAHGEQKGVHMGMNEHNLTLDQLATEAHSNKITAILQLLDLIDIQGDTVTIDAIGCQSQI